MALKKTVSINAESALIARSVLRDWLYRELQPGGTLSTLGFCAWWVGGEESTVKVDKRSDERVGMYQRSSRTTYTYMVTFEVYKPEDISESEHRLLDGNR